MRLTLILLCGFIGFLHVFTPFKRLLTDGNVSARSVENVDTTEAEYKYTYDVNFTPSLKVLSELFKHDELSRRPRIHVKQKWRLVNVNKLLTILLLLLAGDIPLNPGPRKPQYPCGLCLYAVSARQRAIQCDNCEFWIHLKCTTSMTIENTFPLDSQKTRGSVINVQFQ